MDIVRRDEASSSPSAESDEDGGGRFADGDPDGYKPSDDEPFMSARQRAYFRRRLVEWRESLEREARETLDRLREASEANADVAEQASSDSARALELRARDRHRKLSAKIDAALKRLDEGRYGYCAATGAPISIGRLLARPVATLSLEAQRAHEKSERVHRER